VSSLVERSKQFIDRRVNPPYIRIICILFLVALGLVLTAAVFLLVIPLLIKAWYQVEPAEAKGPIRIWALTLAWTPVLNLYMGIYDSSIVVLAALLTSDVFFRTARGDEPALPPALKYIFLLLYLTPWVTQPLARATGIQIYTLVIALFGCYQILQFRRQPSSRMAAVTTQFRR
jgi:hypothetical protein